MLFCNKAVKKIYTAAEKYLTVPSDLNQHKQNDDNNRNYRGGRTR